MMTCAALFFSQICIQTTLISHTTKNSIQNIKTKLAAKGSYRTGFTQAFRLGKICFIFIVEKVIDTLNEFWIAL